MSPVAQADFIIIYLRMILNIPTSLPRYRDYGYVPPLRFVWLFEQTSCIPGQSGTHYVANPGLNLWQTSQVLEV